MFCGNDHWHALFTLYYILHRLLSFFCVLFIVIQRNLIILNLVYIEINNVWIECNLHSLTKLYNHDYVRFEKKTLFTRRLKPDLTTCSR